MHLVHRHSVHTGHLVLLLPLHPPVLEPDLYLSLSQAEGVSNLNSEKMINDIRTMPARLK